MFVPVFWILIKENTRLVNKCIALLSLLISVLSFFPIDLKCVFECIHIVVLAQFSIASYLPQCACTEGYGSCPVYLSHSI